MRDSNEQIYIYYTSLNRLNTKKFIYAHCRRGCCLTYSFYTFTLRCASKKKFSLANQGKENANQQVYVLDHFDNKKRTKQTFSNSNARFHEKKNSVSAFNLSVQTTEIFISFQYGFLLQLLVISFLFEFIGRSTK